MDLSTIHVGVNKRKKKKRVGRGPGSGTGRTATRGNKGAYARSGANLPIALHEGGQMPLVRRIPKRGFNQNAFRKVYAVVNVGDLDREFTDGDEVNPEALAARGLAKGAVDGVRILGDGELAKKLRVAAHGFSRVAVQKIEARGGKAVVLPGPKPPVRNKMKPRPPKQ